MWKRELCYLNILFATALVGAVRFSLIISAEGRGKPTHPFALQIGPLIAPGFVTIAKEFDVPVNKVAATNAALVLASESRNGFFPAPSRGLTLFPHHLLTFPSRLCDVLPVRHRNQVWKATRLSLGRE